MHENELATVIVDSCFQVHQSLGPGLLESPYEKLLAIELRERGIHFARQVPVRISYRGIELNFGFRADFVVGEKVIIEVKSIETLAPVHYKQLLTYLRFANLKLGILVNFNEALIKNGIRRVANNL